MALTAIANPIDSDTTKQQRARVAYGSGKLFLAQQRNIK